MTRRCGTALLSGSTSRNVIFTDGVAARSTRHFGVGYRSARKYAARTGARYVEPG